MSKSIKIFSIILIIFSLFISFYGVYATTDINMNLESNEPTQNEVTEGNTIADSLINDALADGETPSTTTQDILTPPTSIGAVTEEGLTLPNILSILLITVGVVLILLAIAIIIRLK